jgi:YidC/Oxa1 family membrane protein insertase
VYAIEIGNEKPMLRISKRFEIQPTKSPAGGYEALVRHTLTNLSGATMDVVLGVGGPVMPPREVDRGPDRNVLAGYNDNPDYKGTAQVKAEAHALESLTGSKQTIQVVQSSKGWPMIWAGMTSTYFDALVLPVAKDPLRTAEFIDTVQVNSLHADDPAKITAEMLFQTRSMKLADATPMNLDMQVFFGPKARSILNNGYYDVYPREYATSLVNSSWCCPAAVITPLMGAMVWMLRAFHLVLRDWGLAIIALVILVRVVMHPLTRKSTISMQKMSKLAPEMERIKKKYADNPEEQQRAMMQFQKEYAPGMMLGCLPMFIQMPIWVALWSCLQSTFELRLAPFLWGYTWIKDLARPDHLLKFEPFTFFFLHIDGINILPLLLAVVFYVQQKIQPQQPATTPEQEQQQKMMRWMMVLMFPLMLYGGPAGLNLYILTSTTIGIMESWWIRKHIRAQEAALAVAGPVIIDAPATRGARRRADGKVEPEQPQGLIGKWWNQVMTMAENAQKQAQQKQTPQKKDRKGK